MPWVIRNIKRDMQPLAQQEWSVFPIPEQDHWSYVDEGIKNANITDWWRAVDIITISKTDWVAPIIYVHPELDDNNAFPMEKVRVALYYNGINIDGTPGIQVILRWEGSDQKSLTRSAATGGVWMFGVFEFTGLSLTRDQYRFMTIKVRATVGEGFPPIPQLE